jgi:hypothetical protein
MNYKTIKNISLYGGCIEIFVSVFIMININLNFGISLSFLGVLILLYGVYLQALEEEK